MKKVPFVTLEKLNEITEKYPTLLPGTKDSRNFLQ